MYVCLHPVAYNSSHVHVGTISCLLEVKDKMKHAVYLQCTCVEKLKLSKFRYYFVRNFVFTSESLSLFRVLSLSSMFLCTTITSIFAYFKCIVIVTAVHVKMKLGDNTLNNESLYS